MFFKPTRFQMRFLGILHRILRSTYFNILMLVIGFCVGFFHATMLMHYNAIANSNYEFITKIEQAVEDLSKLDIEYVKKQEYILAQLKKFRYKISHDHSNIDNILKINTCVNTNILKTSQILHK